MPITIRAVGQASKRRMIPRLPSPERLLAEVDAWLATATADTLRGRSGEDLPSGATTTEMQLHPAARNVRIEAAEGGRLTVTAITSPVGPGYHTYVSGLLRRMGEELEIEWLPAGAPEDGDGSSDVTGFFESADRADAERGHLTWLHHGLLAARDARQRGATAIHLETPPGARFTFSGAIATVLGPRSEEWLDRAIADPRVATDVWPWVADAMDARYLLGRALCLLWLEVRWRPPSDEEERLLDEVIGLLRRAYPLDPALPYPWGAWRELLTLRDHADPATQQLVDRMVPTADGEPPIGYRRAPVTIIHEGWALDVPGSFGEHRSAEEWTGAEARRSITLAATETGEAGQPMSAEDFLKRVAGHLGSDAIEHEDGPVRGRARLSTETSSGVEVATVEGYSAVRGRGAAIRIVIEDPQDWKWALDTWRDLRPA
ncbi:MAG: hypothetical protein QOI09_1543 [Chloroflexota bacterium]|nr:hypothetical protein [Chloroflexota bacterium]